MPGSVRVSFSPELDSYVPAQEVRISMEVRDVDGALADPGSLTLKVLRPDGTELVLTYAAAQIIRDGVGLFHYDLLLSSSFTWRVRVESATPTAAVEDAIPVSDTPFVDDLPPLPGPGGGNEGSIARVTGGVYAPYAGADEQPLVWRTATGWVSQALNLASENAVSGKLAHSHIDDFASSQIANDSGVAGATVKAALDALAAAANVVSSVFGRTGAVVATLGDYAASKITNDSSVTGATVKDALNALAAFVGVSSVFGRVGAVVATLGDYAASLVTNDSSLTGATVKDALNALGSSVPIAGASATSHFLMRHSASAGPWEDSTSAQASAALLSGLSSGGLLWCNLGGFATAGQWTTDGVKLNAGPTGVLWFPYAGPAGVGCIDANDSTGTLRRLLRIGVSAADELTWGVTTAWSHSFQIKASTGYFDIFDGTTHLFKAQPSGISVGADVDLGAHSIVDIDHIQGPQTGTFPDAGFVRVKNGFVGLAFIKASGTGKVIGMYLDSGNSIQVGQRTGSWVCPSNIALTFDSGGTFAIKSDDGTTATNIWTSAATGHDAKNLPVANVAKLNGARPAAPTQGTDLGDASVTVSVSGGANYYMPANTLSANRVITLGTAGHASEIPSIMSFIVESQASFTLEFKDDAGTHLFTIAAATPKGVYDVAYNTTSGHYQPAGYKPLQ